MSPQRYPAHLQKAIHDVQLLDHCYKKELDNNKAKDSFFTLSLKIISMIMFTIQMVIMTQRPWRHSRLFWVHYSSNLHMNLLFVIFEIKHLVAQNFLSLVVKVVTILHLPPINHLIVLLIASRFSLLYSEVLQKPPMSLQYLWFL